MPFEQHYWFYLYQLAHTPNEKVSDGIWTHEKHKRWALGIFFIYTTCFGNAHLSASLKWKNNSTSQKNEERDIWSIN